MSAWCRRMAVVLAPLLVVLAACGSSSGGTGGAPADPPGSEVAVPGTAGSPPSSSPSSPSSAGPIVDAMGRSVDVPPAPSRIVALSEPTIDGLVTLDITPVGITAGRGQSGASGYLADRVAGVPVVAMMAAPNLEAIAALDPDMIVIDGTFSSDEALVELLDEVAPTVFVSVTAEDWKVAFRALADAVGRRDRAEQVLAGYEDRVAWLQAELGPEIEATVSIVRWGLLAPALILRELLPGRVVADIGFRRPPFQDREGPGHSEPLSVEELRLIDADWVFFGTLGESSGQGPGGASPDGTGRDASREALARAETVPGFTSLSAYQTGRIIPVDGSAWMTAGGPMAASTVLDDIVTAVVGAP